MPSQTAQFDIGARQRRYRTVTDIGTSSASEARQSSVACLSTAKLAIACPKGRASVPFRREDNNGN